MIGNTADKILQIAHEVGAIKYGNFTLASGTSSSYYFDGRLISLHPEGAYLIGRAIMDTLTGSDVKSIGGPATAAIPLVTATAIVSHLDGKPIEAFFVRSQAKDHGTNQSIEGSIIPGSSVAIVDDVCTSGNSIFTTIEAVEKIECKVESVIVLLDRDQGGATKITDMGYKFVALLKADASGKIRKVRGDKD